MYVLCIDAALGFILYDALADFKIAISTLLPKFRSMNACIYKYNDKIGCDKEFR